jgi:hypothetical protein
MIRNETGLLGPDALPSVIDLLKKAISLPVDKSTQLPDGYDAENDYYNLGLAYEESGRYDEADAALSTFLDTHPNDVGVTYERANIKWKQGRNEDTVQLYRQALKIRPHFLEALNNLAEVLIAVGSPAQAEAVVLGALYDAQGEWLVKDAGQRWRLYDTYAAAQLGMAAASGDDRFYPSALSSLDFAVALIERRTAQYPGERDAIALCYLRRGVCQAQLGRISQARSSLWGAYQHATPFSQVALASSRTLHRLPLSGSASWSIPLGPAGAGFVCLSIVVLIFAAVEMVRGTLNSAAFAAVAVACLGAAVIGICLPRLTSFKFGSTEATLQEQIIFTTIDAAEVSFTTPPRH